MTAKKGWKGVNYQGDGSSEKVEKAFNATAKWEHLDGDYELLLYKEVKTTDQGLLLLAELKPKTTSLPSFSIRWDQKDGHLNVDIHGVNVKEQGWFRSGKNGYSGHVAQKALGDVRACDLDVRIPGRHVFKGHLDFKLSALMHLHSGVILTATASIEVVKPKSKP